MSDLHLICGNRNYSSWSMRAWLAMREPDIPFTESTIWLDTATSQGEKLEHNPAGRVPILKLGDFAIWDSLAIVEFVAERFPDHGLWPGDAIARARARSLCAEMHSSFTALRDDLPLNCRARKQRKERRAETQRDIDRIQSMWAETRKDFGRGGDFLFGAFCSADAFFAPVVSRFVTYDVPVDDGTRSYMEAILAVPRVQEWLAGAESEGHDLPHVDVIDG